MSIVKSLATTTLNTIASTLELRENGSEAQPFKVLRSAMSPQAVGAARWFHGAKGEQLVYIGLSVPMIQLDSHMVFCFTGPDSLVPHFTVDAVHAGDHHAFHLDLIPRVDLGVNLSYMRQVYEPLTPVQKAAQAIPGLSAAHLSPTQLAVMSPWMLAHRADAGAMDAVGQVCSDYLGHWLTLHKLGVNVSTGIHGQAPAERDQIHRSVLFDREVDPVWLQVDRLLGREASEELRSLLLGRSN
jgi:hypothetical protein